MSATSTAALAVALTTAQNAGITGYGADIAPAFVDAVPPELAIALVQGDIIIDRGADAVPHSKVARSLIAQTLDWLSKQSGISKPRREGHEAAGVKQSKGIRLEGAEVLETFNSSTVKRISTRSIARYLIAMALLSHPLDALPTKIRQPSARYQKRARPRTPAELEGLRRGNARRAAEAKQRREVKAPSHV